MFRNLSFLLTVSVTCLWLSCGNDDDTPPPPPLPETGVRVELDAMPFDQLSDYRFFTGELGEMNPNEGLLEYEPISTLFADYAHKKRYLWLPEGTNATYVADSNVFDFPESTVIIKTFFYERVLPADEQRLIETRLLYKKNGRWEFADYIWNEEQTEATFSLAGSFVPLDFIDDAGTERSVRYRIPSQVECQTCHKTFEQNTPLGPKPQNLNAEFAYADGSRMNQIDKLREVGFLSGGPQTADIQTVIDWQDESQDLGLRVRAYLDINCSSCHRDGGHCDYRPLRLSFAKSQEAVNLGICVEADQPLGPSLSTLVRPGNTAKSVLFERISTTDERERMPLLGRSLVHDDAVDMIAEWISSLDDCP